MSTNKDTMRTSLWGNFIWWMDERLNHWLYEHWPFMVLFSRRFCDYNDRLLREDGYVCWGRYLRTGGAE